VALSLLVGRTMLTTVVNGNGVRLVEPSLDPSEPLPHALDYFGIRFSLSPR
jgi:hypothetical protein